MKIIVRSVLLGLFVMVLFASSSLAIERGDLIGSWDVVYASSLTANGLATDAEAGTGVITFNEDRTYDLVLDETVTLTGRYRITGRSVHIKLDSDGKASLEADIINWATEVALEEGITITLADLHSLNIAITPSVLHKKAVVPGKVKLKIQGYADVDGFVDVDGTEDTTDDVPFSVRRKFKETLTISFVGPHVEPVEEPVTP